ALDVPAPRPAARLLGAARRARPLDWPRRLGHEGFFRRRPPPRPRPHLLDDAGGEHRRRIDGGRDRARISRRTVGVVVGWIGGARLGGARDLYRVAHPSGGGRARPENGWRFSRAALRPSGPRDGVGAAVARLAGDP